MQNNKRSIGIFGSTGSIGTSTCKLLQGELKEKFTVEFLLCNNNYEKISEQINILKPKVVCISSEIYLKIKNTFPDIIVYDNPIQMLKSHKTDVMIYAISGISGIKYIIPAIESTGLVAMANKEAIVSAWNFMQKSAMSNGTQIIPVDSEHNSLYRILEIISPEHIGRLGITASGGPFFGKSFASLKNIKPHSALEHPIWKMGVKNSIDSATMANKALELIEVMQLFSCNEENIDVTINIQSIVHASILLRSGGMLSFSSKPDMKSHIAHAIMYPGYEPIMENILNNIHLDFYEIKKDEFPVFFLGREVAKTEDPIKFTIFNIANEIAVQKFLKEKIKYTEILNIIEKSLEIVDFKNPSSIKDLIKISEEIYQKIENISI